MDGARMFWVLCSNILILRLILVKLWNCFLWCERHICLLLTFYSLLE